MLEGARKRKSQQPKKLSSTVVEELSCSGQSGKDEDSPLLGSNITTTKKTENNELLCNSKRQKYCTPASNFYSASTNQNQPLDLRRGPNSNSNVELSDSDLPSAAAAAALGANNINGASAENLNFGVLSILSNRQEILESRTLSPKPSSMLPVSTVSLNVLTSTTPSGTISVTSCKTPSGTVQIPIYTDNSRQCTQCGKLFTTFFGLKTHFQNVHLKLMHKCTVVGCNTSLPSKRSIVRHSSNQNLHKKLLSGARDSAAALQGSLNHVSTVAALSNSVENRHLSLNGTSGAQSSCSGWNLTGNSLPVGATLPLDTDTPLPIYGHPLTAPALLPFTTPGLLMNYYLGMQQMASTRPMTMTNPFLPQSLAPNLAAGMLHPMGMQQMAASILSCRTALTEGFFQV